LRSLASGCYTKRMEGVSIERARAAKTQILAELANLPQINGVGLLRTDQGYAVKVNLSGPLENEETIPHEVDGVPIVVDIVGRIEAR
jgi:hypothetical protein